MSRLAQNGRAESVSRDQIITRERGQGNNHFPCLADHEQDWQPYPVDLYSAKCADYTFSVSSLQPKLLLLIHTFSVFSWS